MCHRASLQKTACRRWTAALAPTTCQWTPFQTNVKQEKRTAAALEPRRTAGGLSNGSLDAIAEVIQRQFGVSYRPKYIGRLLRHLGWTRQVQLPHSTERDEALIPAWLAHDWGRIKKARQHGVAIVVFEEFGFSFCERLGIIWVPCGKRPVLPRVEYDRGGVSTAVGLTLSGRIYKRHFLGGLTSQHVVQTLQHFLRRLPQGFVLIWDRASIHKSKEAKAFLDLASRNSD